jgi:histidinol-phosphatase
MPGGPRALRGAVRDALVVCSDAESMAHHGRGAAYQRIVAATALRRTWGDAYGHVLVATGRAEVALDPQMSIWDCAALLPILEEAGGTFTDWRGTPTIDGGEAISTNGWVLAEVLALVGEPGAA